MKIDKSPNSVHKDFVCNKLNLKFVTVHKLQII